MFILLLAFWFPLLVFCKILFSAGFTLYEGDRCNIQNGTLKGTCFSIRNCSWALTRIRQREHVDLCGYVGKTPVVCCPLGDKFGPDESDSTNVSDMNNLSSSSTPLLKDSSSSIAWSERKCEEFYPRSNAFTTAGVGGERSYAEEFPHMAILGYGNEDEKEWKCGGSLISYQHVLTAAHCLYSSDLGQVRYVRLGDLDILNDTDIAEPQDFNVKLLLQHPEYDQSSLKHDIAILVLDRPVKLTDFVKPACLFTGGPIDEYADVTATGWGITEFAGQPSSHLMKFKLTIVENADCRQQYRNGGSRGAIDPELQVCAGSADPDKIIDTCQGDSGGPLQLTNYTRKKHYLVIGITSFGKACGITRSAGVYTSVLSHLPWIQTVVTNNS